MLLQNRTTLTQFLIEERRRRPQATGDFNELMLQIGLACKGISRRVAHGALRRPTVTDDDAGAGPASSLRGYAEEVFVRTTAWTGVLAGLASTSMDSPLLLPVQSGRGKYLLLFDALDDAGGVETNVALGSIFSVLRRSEAGDPASAAEFLRPGATQVAAGYAIYGPATMLVLTVGGGVAGFTLDPETGEFFLTHPDLRVPSATGEFAVNSSNSRFWEPPVQRYVAECLAGRTGARRKDFTMRWIASLVAETHRILMRGGVFLYPRDTRDASKPGKLRLLQECDPIALLIEQAGGRASTGDLPILDLQPDSLQQCVGFVFGSREEVELIENYHRVPTQPRYETPLFNLRGLFREP